MCGEEFCRTALGAFRTDDAGGVLLKPSTALGISADGKIVVGKAVNDAGLERAVIWKNSFERSCTIIGDPRYACEKFKQ